MFYLYSTGFENTDQRMLWKELTMTGISIYFICNIQCHSAILKMGHRCLKKRVMTRI